MSDMSGLKAQALEAYAQRRGRAFVRFDYRGHGAPSGRFAEATIGDWAGDAVAVLAALTAGPQIHLGTPMGHWNMLPPGKAPVRERGWQYVHIQRVGGTLKKKKQ